MLVLATSSGGFLSDSWRDTFAVASLLALVAALVQLVRTQSAADAARRAARATCGQLSANFRIADLLLAVRRTSEIRNHLQAGQDQLAVIRLNDLRELLVQISASDLRTASVDADFQNAVAQVASLERALIRGRRPVTPSYAQGRLQDVADLLNRLAVEARLRMGGTDADT